MLCKKIAEDLHIDEDYIRIISRRNDLYIKYVIKKKNNSGNRIIFHPSRELKVLQKWILNNLLKSFPISEFSSAYSKGDSIKKNAMKHKGSNFIFHTDIKNFFPSITREMLLDFFKENDDITKELKLSKKDIDLILDICLYRGMNLTIGSVASPRIANIFMHDFDISLNEGISKFGNLVYTRYADDIIISSKNYIDNEIVKVVDRELNKVNLIRNPDKTYFMSKQHKRQVTGVVIDNNSNKITVGNKKYKEFQRKIYNFLVKGEGDISRILGYLSFIEDLNKEQYEQLKTIYSKYDKYKQLF